MQEHRRGLQVAPAHRVAHRAVGQVVKTARTDAALDTASADAKPFWNAMKELNEALDRTDTGLTLRDETFFTNLAVSVAAVQQAVSFLVFPTTRKPS